MQDGVRLTLTRWLAAAFQDEKVAMRLGNCISLPQQLIMGLPQGSPLSLVLYNVYTKGQVDLNSNGLNRLFTLADSGLIHKTVTQTQQPPLSRSSWKQCHSGANKHSPKSARARPKAKQWDKQCQ